MAKKAMRGVCWSTEGVGQQSVLAGCGGMFNFQLPLRGGVKPFYNRGLILHKQFSVVGI